MFFSVASMCFFALLGPALSQQQSQNQPQEPQTAWELLVAKYDADKDGKISRGEYPRGTQQFSNMDLNEDGFLTQNDIQNLEPFSDKARSKMMKAMSDRPQPPKVGQVAPDFELPKIGNQKNGEKGVPAKPELIKLSSFRNKKPVALIFGSYT